MGSWPERLQSAIGIESAIVFGVGGCGAWVVASPIAFSSLGSGRSNNPHVPIMPFGIYKISETHQRVITTNLSFKN
jgi:hypothetical protein